MKLLNTTALIAVLAAPAAFAGDYTPKATPVSMETNEAAMDSAELIRTRDITGGAIYTVNEANDEGWEMDWTFNEMEQNLNEIGEIEDIVLSKDGQFKGIVAEVGGFLDIGDKHVMIPVSDVKLVAVDDQTYAYVTRLNEEQLEELPSVDEGFWN